MPLKIVRNDITKMNTEAIVNTASQWVMYGAGIDTAVYKAAGEKELLAIREEIGEVPEGEAFLTPGLNLPAKYIIHAVSPIFIDGESGEEEKLRNCYKNSLKIAAENNIKSISFPLISTGSYGYPKADSLRIAMDECNAFLLDHNIDIYIVVFDTRSTQMAERLFPQLEAYIDHNYVCEKSEMEYDYPCFESEKLSAYYLVDNGIGENRNTEKPNKISRSADRSFLGSSICRLEAISDYGAEDIEAAEIFTGESELEKRMQHLSDPFGRYMMYLIETKGKSSTQVQDAAWISKKVYSKIKTHQDTYHPDKRTACQICLGIGLNFDETKDLLMRAGYALTNSDKEDLIWSFFFEREPVDYDIFDVSDALEKYGLKPIVVL